MSHIIKEADGTTSVLLVHAPYPGRLKFDGEPSSLLYAVTPAVLALAAESHGDDVGMLDPRESSPEFYERLRTVLLGGRVRVVAISTSSAAIEETARIVRLVRETAGSSVLMLVGGPHEDDCETKSAEAIAGIDLSIGGDAEHVLAFVIPTFLAKDETPASFCRALPRELAMLEGMGGRGTIASPWWDAPAVRPFDLGALDIRTLPPRCRTSRPVRFSVFESRRTVPVMVSRGCTYGQCTFCAEGIGGDRASVLAEFGWIESLIESNAGAALYFQDSIFPSSKALTERLLPVLRASGVEWGCQVYLPMLSRRSARELAKHGCRYVYTGIESGSDSILRAVGKGMLSRAMTVERLQWIHDEGMRSGLSVMFGAMNDAGEAIEDETSIDATASLCHSIAARGIGIAGLYPNVETVLPGTALARSLAASGRRLDWYRPPRTDALVACEDGFIGFNYASLAESARRDHADRLTQAITAAVPGLVGLGDAAW